MENASKALLMAGGVLLALMILALVVYVATYMGNMADSQDTKLVAEQLAEFNKSYEAYNKTRLYGTDVLTVYNKAKSEKDYIIEIEAIDKDENSMTIENTKDFKRTIFTCTDIDSDGKAIEYNKDGRIKSMEFKQIVVD